MEETINTKLEILNYFSLFRNAELIKNMIINKFQLNLISKCRKDIINLSQVSEDSQEINENLDIVNYMRPILADNESREQNKKDLILWEALDIEEKNIIFSRLNNKDNKGNNEKEIKNDTIVNNFVL